MIEHLPPGMILILGALLVPLLRGRVQKAYLLLLPILGFIHVYAIPLGTTWDLSLFSFQLQPLHVDKLSKVFGYIFHIAAFLGFVYALHVKDLSQHVAALMYAGSAIAAAFVGDLISLFVFWELTGITSVFLVWARRTERARRAGMRYLIVQVTSGVLLLAGAVLHVADTGSIAFGHLGLHSPGTTLIFLAFGIKAAFPFLHNWLQDAYPEATVTGTVFLSTFTTKLAIYALARGFAGTEILIPIGAVMTVFPIFFAVIENDLRRVLAYSLNNQLGFMVVGIGIGTEMSLNGTCSHAFAHILYKSLLFMSMGAVLFRTGTIKASKLGGLYKSMPLTTVFCIVASMSISGMPFFSGFISKSMILTAAGNQHLTLTLIALLFASAGVMDHSGIKIPFFAFFAHDSGIRVKEAPLNMLLAMGTTAALCIGIGLYPKPLYDLLPFPVEFAPYTTTHIITQFQLLLFAALAFVTLKKIGVYPPELPSVNIDTDWTYRKAAPAIIRGLERVGRAVLEPVTGAGRQVVHTVLDWTEREYKPYSPFGEPWLSGVTTVCAALLLAAYCLLHFL